MGIEIKRFAFFYECDKRGKYRFLFKKKTLDKEGLLLGTRSRGRTGTISLSLVFETSASTNSAIRACFGILEIGNAKIVTFQIFKKQ